MTNKMTAPLAQMALMAFQYLRGRKLRTTLTTLAIVFGVAVIFSVNLVLPNIVDAFTRTMTTASGTADISVVSAAGESFKPGGALQTAAKVNGVKAVTGVLHRQINLPTLEQNALGKTAQIDIVGVDVATSDSVQHYNVSQGRFLQPGDTGTAVLPAGIAELAPQLKVGTTFPLITAGGLRLFTIVGFVVSQGSLTTPEIIVTLDDAQKLFNQPGLINTIEIALQPGADREAVSSDLIKALGDSFQVGGGGAAASFLASVQIGYAATNLLGLLALFIAAFLIFNTFRTVILERRHDLAMLRAIGAEKGQLTMLILVESLVQGVIGTALGLALGYLFALSITSFYNKFATEYVPGTHVSLTLTASSLLTPIVLGILTTLIAGYLPARAAGRVSPLDALRPTTAASSRRAARAGLIIGVVVMVVASLLLVGNRQTAAGGALLFLIGMVIAAPGLVLPVARLFSPLLTLWFAREGDLARSNLTRQPGRAAITASTLMIGLAVLILMAAVVTSLGSYVSSLFSHNLSSDLILLPQSLLNGSNLGADENLITRLRAVPEVDAVGSIRYASSTLKGQTVQVIGIDPANYPKVSPLDFAQGTPEEAYPALSSGRVAIFNPIGAGTFKVTVGDDITLPTVEGPQTYHVIAIASDALSFKLNTIFISQANIAADFLRNEDLMIMINLKPGADKAAAKQAVEAVAADYPQFTVRVTGEYRQTLIDESVGAMNFFYIIALLILIPASLGLLNTLTINILERTREIGVIRATGGSRAQVRRIVTAEAILLGLFGASIGTLAGVAMSYGFIAAFATFGWALPYSFPLAGVVAAIALAVLLALVSSIIPARSAAKLDIIRALQYE
jgi:putative ABC transport system permease protein